jgi:GT2 family glycosyltransferase
VVAVVVTWNRLELLQESLAAVHGQTHAPAAIVVVDNDSTDGTRELLDSSYAADLGLDVVHLRQNTGGAGGFAVGIEQALLHHPDLVWLLDDDTVPTPDAAEELVRAWEAFPGARPAVLASRVVWTDGRDHPMNTPRRKPGASADEVAAAERVGAVPIRSASFV